MTEELQEYRDLCTLVAALELLRAAQDLNAPQLDLLLKNARGRMRAAAQAIRWKFTDELQELEARHRLVPGSLSGVVPDPVREKSAPAKRSWPDDCRDLLRPTDHLTDPVTPERRAAYQRDWEAKFGRPWPGAAR